MTGTLASGETWVFDGSALVPTAVGGSGQPLQTEQTADFAYGTYAPSGGYVAVATVPLGVADGDQVVPLTGFLDSYSVPAGYSYVKWSISRDGGATYTVLGDQQWGHSTASTGNVFPFGAPIDAADGDDLVLKVEIWVQVGTFYLLPSSTWGNGGHDFFWAIKE